VWRSGGIAAPFLTSEVDGDKFPASRPGRLILGERNPGVRWVGASVAPVPVQMLWRREKSFALVGNRIPAVQPVDSCYPENILYKMENCNVLLVFNSCYTSMSRIMYFF
jgi:hypothetical protein